MTKPKFYPAVTPKLTPTLLEGGDPVGQVKNMTEQDPASLWEGTRPPGRSLERASAGRHSWIVSLARREQQPPATQPRHPVRTDTVSNGAAGAEDAASPRNAEATESRAGKMTERDDGQTDGWMDDG